LSPEQTSINLWSKYLYNYFANIQDELIWLSLDDFLPINNINIDCYNAAVDYMKNNKIGLCTISQTIYYESKDYRKPGKCIEGEKYFIYERNKKDLYNISLQPGLWNREYLCKIFNNNFTPWDVEIKGTKKSYTLPYINIGTCRGPRDNITSLMEFSYVSSLSSKWNPYINFQGFPLELIKEIIDNKLVNKDLITIGDPYDKIVFNPDVHDKFFFRNLHKYGGDHDFFLKNY